MCFILVKVKHGPHYILNPYPGNRDAFSVGYFTSCKSRKRKQWSLAPTREVDLLTNVHVWSKVIQINMYVLPNNESLSFLGVSFPFRFLIGLSHVLP